MKKNKLFTSVLAAGIALTSAFSVVGCGRPNPDGSHGDSGRADKPYDDTKTQVRIWTYMVQRQRLPYCVMQSAILFSMKQARGNPPICIGL